MTMETQQVLRRAVLYHADGSCTEERPPCMLKGRAGPVPVITYYSERAAGYYTLHGMVKDPDGGEELPVYRSAALDPYNQRGGVVTDTASMPYTQRAVLHGAHGSRHLVQLPDLGRRHPEHVALDGRLFVFHSAPGHGQLPVYVEAVQARVLLSWREEPRPPCTRGEKPTGPR